MEALTQHKAKPVHGIIGADILMEKESLTIFNLIFAKIIYLK
jgi:hypothetical protein